MTLFSSSSCVLPKSRVRCVQTLLQGRGIHVSWWSAHEWGCVPSNVTPWTLPKSLMHLTRWYPHNQRKPVDLPENTKLWLPSNTRLVKKINHYEMAYVKMVYKLTMAGGAVLVKAEQVVTRVWRYYEPNRPLYGWDFCLCLLSLNACLTTLAFCMFHKARTLEEKRWDKIPSLEESYSGRIKYRREGRSDLLA